MDAVSEKEQNLARREQSLREEIGRSGRELEELEREFAALGDELAALDAERPRYEALIRLCAAVDELDETGAAELFWGHETDGPIARDACLQRARVRLDAFEAERARLQDERVSLGQKIGKQNLVLEHLDYSLSEVLEAEEARRAEWLIEREESDGAFRRGIVMPWTRGCEEDARFQRALAMSAMVALLIGFAVPFVDLPIPEREELIEVPERVARLVERQRPPPVEAVAPVIEPTEPEPEPEPEPEVEAEPLLAEEVVPELSEEPAETVAETPAPASTREAVKTKGILAFRDSFAERAGNRTRARLGSNAELSRAGSEAVGLPTRSMVTSSAPGSSGGINLADISRDVGGGGGGALEGVRVTQAESTIGGDGSAERPLAGGPSAGRTDEEIQIVFDRYKASLYRLYNRELRKDPTLRGQIVLRLTIEPDGSVSFCELKSSDMEAPALTQQIVNRVSGFDFGAKEDILAVTIVYPIDFLPAA